MHIEADQEKCVGAGQCAMTAPDLFDQREEDGIVELLDADPDAAHATLARAAETQCP
ncbi:ferredoxin, partial [Pseudonocardia pini]|uniref:ferredoxin n=1 Tax=Pseudonocardia pini TaxID=2758030 RepID=UPI0015F07ED2